MQNLMMTKKMEKDGEDYHFGNYECSKIYCNPTSKFPNGLSLLLLQSPPPGMEGTSCGKSAYTGMFTVPGL